MLRNDHSSGKPPLARGFTILEVMISTSLFSIIMMGATSVLMQSMNMFHYDIGKLLVNRDIRNFTSEMTENASFANYYMVFPSFEERTRTVQVGDSESGYTEITVDAAVNDGLSGDFLLLVYTDPEDSAVISRVVGYFRAPSDANNSSSEGPVRRFVTDFPNGATGNIWDLMPAVETANAHPEVVELSRGLSNGRLFYNFRDRSVMVKGKIFHNGDMNRRATNTYNFTVSPRG